MNSNTTPAALALLAMLASPAFGATELRTHDTDASETLAAGSTLEIDDLVGSIVATPASGDRATIHAHATSNDGDPSLAVVRILRTPSGLRVCVAYPGDDDEDCRDRSHHERVDRTDIGVDFTVTVPPGVLLKADVVDGNVRATGLRGDAKIATVHGNVTLATAGRAEAATVDGSLDVRLTRLDGDDVRRFQTVNGPIHVSLPRDAGATIEASTINGAIHGERGLALSTHDGQFVGHNASTKIGNGGPRISLHTINGEISVGFD